MKVIILGVDGATWDMLLPRARRGQMPHLAALLEQAAWGEMQSTTPPFSAQAWVSLATGKNQARHGVVDFWERRQGLAPGERTTFVTSRHVHGETLWQTAGRHGLTVGVVNVPVTYPPTAVNGLLVSGFLTPPGVDDYAFPAALKAEIEALVPGYRPDPFDPLGASSQQLAELFTWMEKHEVVARALMERHPSSLFFSVVQALDHLQHLFWDDVAQGIHQNNHTDRFFTLADDIIGHRLAHLDGQTALFIVSDHGFGPVRKWFHVNRFLQERGLLALSQVPATGLGSILGRLGITPHGLRSLIRRLDVLGLRRRVGRLARVTMGRKIDGALVRPIDWSQTQAVSASPAGEGIYINLKGRESQGIVEPGEPYEALRQRLIAELLALRDPETGEQVVRAVHRREELYEGPFLDLLPDLVFDLGDGPYLASDALPSAGKSDPRPQKGSPALALQPAAGAGIEEPLPHDVLQGRHRPAGVLAAVGPGIRPGFQIAGARIVDVAPTVLYALGLPLPDDMDGRPLLDIFDDDFRAGQPLLYDAPAMPAQADALPSSEEETAEMERRLRGLGYLS